MNQDASLRRKSAALSLIAAPVLLTLADLLAIQDVLSRYARHSYAGLVAHLVAILVLFAATLGLVHLLRRRAPGYSLAVCAAAAVGFMGGSNIMAVRLYQWALQVSLDPGLFAQTTKMPGAVQGTFFPTIFLPGLFTPLALVLIGIGLWRWTDLPRWSLALFLLGAVLFPAGRVSVTLPLILLSDAALLVSLIFLGVTLMRRPELWTRPDETA